MELAADLDVEGGLHGDVDVRVREVLAGAVEEAGVQQLVEERELRRVLELREAEVEEVDVEEVEEEEEVVAVVVVVVSGRRAAPEGAPSRRTRLASPP